MDPTGEACGGAQGAAYVCPAGAKPDGTAPCIARPVSSDGTTGYCCLTGCTTVMDPGCSSPDGGLYGLGAYDFNCPTKTSPQKLDWDLVCPAQPPDAGTNNCCSYARVGSCVMNNLSVADCNTTSTSWECSGSAPPPVGASTTCAYWGTTTSYGPDTLTEYCCTDAPCTPAIIPAGATPCTFGMQAYYCAGNPPSAASLVKTCTLSSAPTVDANHAYYCCM